MADLKCTDEVQGTGEVSLRKRYFFKLMTNLLGLGIGLVSQSIVPRALGPAAYGDFSFLSNFFWQVVGFLNFNSSSAFYTRLSQRQDDNGLVKFYFCFVLLLGFILSLGVAVSFLIKINHVFWPGQAGAYVAMGVAWAFLTFCAMIVNEMSDAYGLTVKTEVAKVALKFLGLMIVLVMFWNKWFSLGHFFLYHYIILLSTILIVFRIIHCSGHTIFNDWNLKRNQLTSYAREFSTFCLPLVFFTGASVLEGILDRWFLQSFSGSTQQGFYGLAYQIGAICFLFSSAMIPLLTREFAISFGNKDLDEMRRLFLRFIPMLYVVVAYFCCFLAIESHNVMLLFGGKAYSGAVLPITIMCFYPIHQTYGQINGSVFFATSRTVAYRNIGVGMIVIGLPLTFILLGPKEYGALQSGATGLSVKMVVMQLLGVNIQLWFNSKMLRVSFHKLVYHQLVVVIAFVVAALLCSHVSRSMLQDFHFSLQFLVSGFLYSLCILGVVLLFPSICSMSRAEVVKLLGYLKWKKEIA